MKIHICTTDPVLKQTSRVASMLSSAVKPVQQHKHQFFSYVKRDKQRRKGGLISGAFGYTSVHLNKDLLHSDYTPLLFKKLVYQQNKYNPM